VTHLDAGVVAMLLVGAGWWIGGLVRRAEHRAQRRTDAYVGACDAVKAIASVAQSGATPNAFARAFADGLNEAKLGVKP
jgi:hypothetical protein